MPVHGALVRDQMKSSCRSARDDCRLSFAHRSIHADLIYVCGVCSRGRDASEYCVADTGAILWWEIKIIRANNKYCILSWQPRWRCICSIIIIISISIVSLGLRNAVAAWLGCHTNMNIFSYDFIRFQFSLLLSTPFARSSSQTHIWFHRRRLRRSDGV